MHDDHVWLLNARFNLVSASSKCGGEGLSFFRGLWRPCRAKTLPPLVGLDTRNSLISKRFSRPFSCSINFLKSIFEDFSPNTNTHFNPLPPPFSCAQILCQTVFEDLSYPVALVSSCAWCSDNTLPSPFLNELIHRALEEKNIR